MRSVTNVATAGIVTVIVLTAVLMLLGVDSFAVVIVIGAVTLIVLAFIRDAEIP